LNKFFATNFSKDEWRAVMKPENKKTLLDVCTLISSRATLPALNETKFLGASCKTASAFLALRASLQGAGVNVTGLRPSSKLDNVLRLHLQTIANAVSKLAPGRMPKIRSRSNLAFKIFAWMALASLTVFIASEFVAAPLLSAVSCVTLILSFMGVGICSSLPPAEVHFEGLETFADLNRLIAGGIENRKTKLAL
jgi:hypothetical protein